MFFWALLSILAFIFLVFRGNVPYFMCSVNNRGLFRSLVSEPKQKSLKNERTNKNEKALVTLE